jgi:hypothetical protein
MPKLLGNQSVELVYIMPKGLLSKLGKGSKGQLAGHKIYPTWEKMMTAAHNMALKSLNLDAEKYLPEFTDQNVADEGYLKLGSHPQGFYECYISEGDAKKLKEAGGKINFGQRPRAFPEGDKLGNLTILNINNSGLEEETQTRITWTKVVKCKNFPRIKTQAAVMGVSATDASSSYMTST